MSDNPTQETPDTRSFEERVFARFDALDGRMDRLDARMDRFEIRLEGKVDALDGRLTVLEEKVDARLRETRPIWEGMQADLTVIKGDVKEIKRGLKNISYDLLRVRGEVDELDERVEKLESQSTR